jgi:hypothetical protein
MSLEIRKQKLENKAANFQLCVSSFPLLPSGFSAPRRRALSISSRLAAKRALAPSTTQDKCQPTRRESKGSPVVCCSSLPTTYKSFFIPNLPPTKCLCFHQHSRFKELSTCVFIDIPGSLRTLESRPFVFIDIPASFGQKKNSFFRFLRRFDPSDKLSD